MKILDNKPALERAIQLGAACDSCHFQNKEGPVYFKTAKKDTPYEFSVSAVGRFPGRTELGTGEPMTGKTGFLFKTLLKDLNLNEHQVHLTNATLCTAFEIIKKKDKLNAINCCRPRLANELASNKLQLVFLLGTEALYSVTGKDSIKAWRGFPLRALEIYDNDNTIYFPTFHPIFIDQEPAFTNIWKLDVIRAIKFMQMQLQPVEWPVVFADDDEQMLLGLESILKRCETGPVRIGTDVETAGKEPLLDKLLCASIAVSDLAVCAPARSRYSETKPLFKRIIEHNNAQLLCHNGIHDFLSYERYGIYPRTLHSDTLSKARILYPRLWHDLGSVVSYHFFISRHKAIFKAGKEDTKGESSWEKASQDPVKFKNMKVYCAKDSWSTLILDEAQTKMLGSEYDKIIERST